MAPQCSFKMSVYCNLLNCGEVELKDNRGIYWGGKILICRIIFFILGFLYFCIFLPTLLNISKLNEKWNFDIKIILTHATMSDISIKIVKVSWVFNNFFLHQNALKIILISSIDFPSGESWFIEKGTGENLFLFPWFSILKLYVVYNFSETICCFKRGKLQTLM